MNFNKRLRLAKEKFEAGELAVKVGSYQQALDLFLDAAQLFKGIKEEEVNYAACLGNAGICWQELGNYKQAQALIDKSLSIEKKFFHNETPKIAENLNNLGLVCYKREDYETAKHHFEEALTIFEKIFGHEHSDTAKALNNLALVYQAQGNDEKAKQLHEEALSIREKISGHEHPDTASSLNNLAILNQKLKNFQEARKLNEEALAIFEQNLGAEHPRVYQSRNNLSNVILAQNTNDSIDNIAQLHETVLQFFVQKLEKTPFYFTLRTPRNDEQGRLSKGYWFLGDEESLYFSFWKGIDNTNQMPTITIMLDIQEQLSVTLNGQDSPQKAEFLQDLTQLFEGFIQVTDGKRWKKTYSQDWQSALEAFLIDKAQIDDYLTLKGGKIEDFSFIPETEFSQSAKFVGLLRAKLKSREIKQLTETGKPLKLYSLQLENIGHFERLGMDLSRQVTILIGENGSGKSTILKALALALLGKAKTLDVELIQDYLRILKTEEDGTKHFCKKGTIHLNLQINAIQSQIIEFNNSELGGVGVETFVDNNDEWLLASENRFIDLVLGFPQGKKRESKSFGKIVEPNLNDVIDLIEDRDISKWKADLVEWIVALYREPDAEKREKNLLQIQWVFDIFSKIISDDEPNAIHLKSAVHDPATGEKDIIICTPDMPDGISLNLLSQGYTNIFIWVGRLVMRLYAALSAHQLEQARDKHLFLRNPNTRGKRYEANTIQELHGIVLIDEIDTYLHPQWQRNILRVLAETFPCLQFIATTHSPLILSNFSRFDIEDTIDGEILKIKGIDFIIYNISKNQENNKITAEVFNSQDYYPFASKSSDVLEQMNVIERPKLIRIKLKQLDELIKAINRNNPSFSQADELITELKEIIDSNDEDLIRLETVLKNKKILLK